MAQKLALVLAVLAVSCITINAAVSGVSPSSNFNVSPVTVVDNATDSSFVNYTGIHFVPGFDNTTVFVYGVNASSTDAAISFVRRSINASTLATINGSDSKISTTLGYNGTHKCAVGLGYLACATVYNSTASSYPDLTLSYTAVNGTWSSVKITSNADYNYTYNPTSVWYDTNYFYVVYVVQNATTTNDVLDESAYLQAVKVTDGSKLYTSPVKVASLSGKQTYVLAGPTNASNSSTINVVYRTNTSNATYYVAVSNGTAGSPVTLFTDAGNVTYIPAGTLGSFSNSGVFVKKIDASTSPSTNSTYGFYNGNTTAVLVAGSSMSGYAAPAVNGIKFTDGYVLFETYAPATGSDSAYYLDYYFANQTRNGTAQVSLGTYGNGLQPFVDANGAVWGGYYSTDSAYGSYVVKAYLGKIIAQINSGASVLASFFAFISLMIAALFAF